MKILIVTPIFPPEIGGPATYSWELLRRLPPEIDVEVVSFSQQENGSTSNVHLVSTIGGMFKRQLVFFRTCLTAGRESDIFYLQEPAVVGLAGLVAAKVLDKKIVSKYVGDPSWEEASRQSSTGKILEDYLKAKIEKPDLLYRVTKSVLKSSDLVITPANHLKNLLQEHYSITQNKIRVIPNSVDFDKVDATKEENSLIYVGRLASWKNLDLVICALTILKKQHQSFRFSIIGSGPEGKKLKEKVTKLNLENNVIFFGSLSAKETKNQIAKNKILVLFSDYEGLSHVILEAFIQKTLVIASDISGNKEIIKSGQNGVLVKNHDISALAKTITEILKNERVRSEIINRAYQKAIASYSWKENILQLKQAFNEVVKQ